MIAFYHLLAIICSVAFGQYCSKGVNYGIIESFNSNKTFLDQSYLRLSSPFLMVCGSECSERKDCLSAIFDTQRKSCHLFNRTFIAESQNSSPFTLMTKKKDFCDEAHKDIFDDHDTTTNSITKTFTDCHDAFENNFTMNGVFTLNPGNSSETFQAMCHFDTVGWTVIQTRLDGTVNFYRNWTEYERGFGSPSHEYWLGLSNIHQLTCRNKRLIVYLESFDGENRTAEYGLFEVGNSSVDFKLLLSEYSGSAGNSLNYHNGMRFSTFDRDSDLKTDGNCATDRKGGWWYNGCARSNLNGKWYSGGIYSSPNNGAYWVDWKGAYYSYKRIYMKVSR